MCEVRRLHALQASMLTEVNQSCSFLDDYHHTPAAWLRCETASGSPVDPHDLVTAALIGQVRRVVVDSTGRVIDLGHFTLKRDQTGWRHYRPDGTEIAPRDA